LFLTRIDGAVALDVTSGPDGPLVAWTTHDSVSLAALDAASGDLVDPAIVSGDLAPVHHAIERPAVIAGRVFISRFPCYFLLRRTLPPSAAPVEISGEAATKHTTFTNRTA
jgi:hypothetical protein